MTDNAIDNVPKEYPIPVNELPLDLRSRCMVSDATILNWIRRYTVTENGGQVPIGIKVGGVWRVFPSRLERFLKGKGTKRW